MRFPNLSYQAVKFENPVVDLLRKEDVLSQENQVDFLNQLPERLVVIDGYCNFCHGTVRWIERYAGKKNFYYTNLQSTTGKKLIALFGIQDANESVLFLEDKQLFTHSTAILRIARKLVFPISLFSFFLILPRFFRDPVYKIVSRHRYQWFGKKTVCTLPETGFGERVLS